MRSDDLHSVPPGLPVPIDDGACDHLIGAAVPSIALPATTGGVIDLSTAPSRWTVVYAYPKTGVPDRDAPAGWDAIAGARGCTPQNCAYRNRHAQLIELGASVYGLSTQSSAYQQEMASRLLLHHPILSDESLAFTRALQLPTFTFAGETLIKRLCLVIEGRRIAHVIYPVFPSDADAALALAWIAAHTSPSDPPRTAR